MERFYPWCVDLGSVMVTTKAVEAANIPFVIDKLRKDPARGTLWKGSSSQAPITKVCDTPDVNQDAERLHHQRRRQLFSHAGVAPKDICESIKKITAV